LFAPAHWVSWRDPRRNNAIWLFDTLLPAVSVVTRGFLRTVIVSASGRVLEKICFRATVRLMIDQRLESVTVATKNHTSPLSKF
jgi:hypothetical protein